MRIFKAIIFVAPFILIPSWQASAQINAWTSTVSGNWEDPSWSLGILPGPGQTVLITNSGYKAVGISHVTVENFQNSLTVSNLQVSAPENAVSVLLLNYAATLRPLRVNGRCEVLTNGLVLNLYSGFEVDGVGSEAFWISGGAFGEEGGTLLATNGSSYVMNAGTIGLTNANARFGTLNLGSPGSAGQVTQSGGEVNGDIWIRAGSGYTFLDGELGGTLHVGDTTSGNFDQFGGTNHANIVVGSNDFYPPNGNGYYVLHSGCISNGWIAIAASSAFVNGDFEQQGGSIDSGSLGIGGSGSFPNGHFNISGGTLTLGGLGVGNGFFAQTGGHTRVRTPLYLDGYVDDYNSQYNRAAYFSLSGGLLELPGISLDFGGGFNQSGGTNIVSGDVVVYRTDFSLSGGQLISSNCSVQAGILTLSDGNYFLRGTFTHSNGVNWVSNTLSVLDQYSLSGGTLHVSNLWLAGTLSLSGAAAVVNPGLCSLGGKLQVIAGNFSFGQLELRTNALLDLGVSAASVSFQRSSSVPWSPGKLLVITNWHGNSLGTGASIIAIGSSAGGITPAQLEQIQFLNPAGFAPGRYAARTLSTGEIVPTPAALFTLSISGSNLTLSWPGGLMLQTATNVSGPFNDWPDALSPIVWNTTIAPAQFFRLGR